MSFGIKGLVEAAIQETLKLAQRHQDKRRPLSNIIVESVRDSVLRQYVNQHEHGEAGPHLILALVESEDLPAAEALERLHEMLSSGYKSGGETGQGEAYSFDVIEVL